MSLIKICNQLYCTKKCKFSHFPHIFKIESEKKILPDKDLEDVADPDKQNADVKKKTLMFTKNALKS